MLTAEAFELINDDLFPWLLAWTLMATRTLGVTLVFAPFSFLGLPMSVRFAVAAALGLPILGGTSAQTLEIIRGFDAVAMGILVVKELVLGVAIGVIAGLPFWAAQNAGELIDTYRGSSAGALFDPTLTTESSELGVAFLLMMIALLVWSGGLFWIVAAIYSSFAIWPILDFAPTLAPLDVANIGSVITSTLMSAFSIAGVILIALFSIDLAFGLAARSIRQFQVFELSLNLKNLAFVILLPLLAYPLFRIIETKISSLENLDKLLGMLK
jgi:type III secretion protein T